MREYIWLFYHRNGWFLDHDLFIAIYLSYYISCYKKKKKNISRYTFTIKKILKSKKYSFLHQYSQELCLEVTVLP